jgi:signal transduction histidine kinase
MSAEEAASELPGAGLDRARVVPAIARAIRTRAGVPPHLLGEEEIAARAGMLFDLYQEGLARDSAGELCRVLEGWARADAGARRGPLGLQLALSALQQAIWSPGALAPAELARADGLLHQARIAVADSVARQVGYHEAAAAQEHVQLLQAGLAIAALDIDAVLGLNWLARTAVRRGLIGLFDPGADPARGADLVVSGGYDASGRLVAPVGARLPVAAFPPDEWAPPADPYPFTLYPVIAEEQLLGWLGLAARPYTGEAQLLRALAADVAAAVLKARLYQIEQRRADQLRLITQVARDVTAVLEPDELLERTAATIQATFRFYDVRVFLRDPASAELVLRAAAGAERAPGARPAGRALEGMAAWAARTGEVVLVPDVTRDPRYRPSATLPATRAELALPLRVGAQVLGVLAISSDRRDGIGADDLQVLQILSDAIAVALRNAQLFEAAELARREALAASRLKSQFLASMSHELRTPLNSIINFTRFVLEGLKGPVTGEQRDYLQRVHDASRHLLALISEVLDLSRIEAGKLHMQFEAVDLAEVVAEVMAAAPGLLAGRPVELQTEIAPGLPPVHGDRLRLAQVLLNLVSNAVKFTERGFIRARAWAKHDRVYVSVQDSGIGMAPEDIPAAFEEFRQLEPGAARRYGGTGLGLPIARRLIELHGGTLWAESARGEGSTFTFCIPAARDHD